MNASESALVSGISHLEVDPNIDFNTPTTGTPIPMSKMSSETLAVLDEAASKLKNLENQPAKGVIEVFKNSMQLIQHQSLDTLHNPNIVSEI